jgi:hypothetical protein
MHVCMYVWQADDDDSVCARPIANEKKRVCMCIYVCVYEYTQVCKHVRQADYDDSVYEPAQLRMKNKMVGLCVC